MSQTGDDLQTALNLLREKGWCKYTLHNGDGQYCARGALSMAVSEPNYHGYEDRLWGAEEVLRKFIPADFVYPGELRSRVGDRGPVPNYNNSCKDFLEIEQWFEKAIAEEGTSSL